MGAVAKSITSERYQNVPEIMQRYEILDGEMIMSAAPTSEYQWIAGKIFVLLWMFVEQRRLGLGRANRGERPCGAADDAVLEIAPDLIVKVLSPDDTHRERNGREAARSPANRSARGMVGQPGSGGDRGRPLTPEGIVTVNIFGNEGTLHPQVLGDSLYASGKFSNRPHDAVAGVMAASAGCQAGFSKGP